MKPICFFFLPLLLLFFTEVHAQQYIEYHRQMNRVDEDILKNELTSALIRFDSIYYRYDLSLLGIALKPYK
jgi:hypothetical protein